MIQPQTIIINLAEKTSLLLRMTSSFTTTIAWFVWAYLVLPIINLIAWIMGFFLFSTQLLDRGNRFNDMDLIIYYFYSFIVIGVLLVLWMGYKTYRSNTLARIGLKKSKIDKRRRFYASCLKAKHRRLVKKLIAKRRTKVALDKKGRWYIA